MKTEPLTLEPSFGGVVKPDYERRGRVCSIRILPDVEATLRERMVTELRLAVDAGVTDIFRRSHDQPNSFGAFVIRMALEGSERLAKKIAAGPDPRQLPLAGKKKRAKSKAPKGAKGRSKNK